MTNDRLKILAEYYFYPWEIEDEKQSNEPAKKLTREATRELRCTYHCSNHSFGTMSDKTVVFGLKDSPNDGPDITTSVDELASALFEPQEQLSLFN